MEKDRLACCVVRDLLPAYLEDLTEPETAELVREHLAGCEACRTLEQDMGAAIPVDQAPRRALNFLKRVKRTRLLAAVLAAALALWCMWWLYDQEYHYPNTEAGRLAAVEEYIPSPAHSTMQHGGKAGTSLRVVDYAQRGRELYIAYGAENRDNVHGILCLEQGWNGKYQPVSASENPFPYTAGVWGETVREGEAGGDQLFALVGEGCREIYGILVTYYVTRSDVGNGEGFQSYQVAYEVTQPDFLWLFELETLESELGIPAGKLDRVGYVEVALLDREGEDVTAAYVDEEVSDNWSGGKSTAERSVLYVFMGIVAALGIVFIRYFLRRD